MLLYADTHQYVCQHIQYALTTLHIIIFPRISAHCRERPRIITITYKKLVPLLAIFIHFTHFFTCGKLRKNYKKFIQKVLDISILSRYYRDSFWINKLFKAKNKQLSSQKNSTLYKSPVSPRSLPGFSLYHLAVFQRLKAAKVVFSAIKLWFVR